MEPRSLEFVSGRSRARLIGFLAVVISMVLLSPSLGQVQSSELGYWGVALGLYPEESGLRGFSFPPDLREVRATGSRAVLLPIEWEQELVDSSEVRRPSGAVDDIRLRRIIRAARRQHLRVALLPFVRIARPGPRDWRGRLAPADPDAWWHSYSRFIAHYARIAAAERVDVLVIGSELTSLSGLEHDERWSALAAHVRSEYSGRLAYVANHDALDRRTPFDHVDVVGLSAYFSLAPDRNAPEETLRQAWQQIAARLAQFAAEVQKPVVIFELGYPSIDGGAMRPWDYSPDRHSDPEEQLFAYRAAVDALYEAPWLDGLFFWMWFGPGGPEDRHYTPRGKPAEAEMRRFLRSRQ